MTKKQEENMKILCVICAFLCYGVASYLLGTLQHQKEDISWIIQDKREGEYIIFEQKAAKSGSIVASKSGKKYYFPWCSGINRIKVENRIYFANEAAAQSRGLTLSKTCD